MRPSRLLAALVAALAVAAWSLLGASFVVADQPSTHSDNGNHYGQTQGSGSTQSSTTTTTSTSTRTTSTPAPAPTSKAHAKSKSTTTTKSSTTTSTTHTSSHATTTSHTTTKSTPTTSSSDQVCGTTHNSDTGHGANTSGPYDANCQTPNAPSGNGNGNGKATGKPCAGCVGNADYKNPHGQMPNGSDHNAGYECDRNHGIGRTNPAHTGCRNTPPPTCPQGQDCNQQCPPGSEKCPPPTCPTGSEKCPPPTCPTGSTQCPPPSCPQGQNCAPTTPTLPTGTTPTPAQLVLGERAVGKNRPASAKRPSNRVRGARAGGTTPSPAAQAARPLAAHRALPFTGARELLIALIGILLLGTGIGLLRLNADAGRR